MGRILCVLQELWDKARHHHNVFLFMSIQLAVNYIKQCMYAGRSSGLP